MRLSACSSTVASAGPGREAVLAAWGIGEDGHQSLLGVDGGFERGRRDGSGVLLGPARQRDKRTNFTPKRPTPAITRLRAATARSRVAGWPRWSNAANVIAARGDSLEVLPARMAIGQGIIFTSALCPQASHVAITTRTPFARIFANVLGGPQSCSRATHLIGRFVLPQPDIDRLAQQGVGGPG
jgi:hypothetical protein